MMRAKLAGFLERPDTVARRYPPSDTSLPARYARAISAYRFGGSRGAIAQIDALIQAQPNNPYFHELKGQALLEGARPAEAIAPLRRAAALAPNATLIRIMLGQALVATGDNALCRRGDLAAARRDAARAGRAGRLLAARHGLRPQGRPRRGRSRLRAGGACARRHEDRARACRARQDPFPDRIARLGQGRRHRRPEAHPIRPVRQHQVHHRPGSERAGHPSQDPLNDPPRPPCSLAAALALAARHARCGADVLAAAARRDREDHQGVPAQASRRCCRRRWRSWRSAAGRRRGREGARRDQEPFRGAVQFAAPGHARQSAGRRHLRRVLRLQLRLLQARARPT